jgi:hypothetical protein
MPVQGPDPTPIDNQSTIWRLDGDNEAIESALGTSGSDTITAHYVEL